MSANRARLTIEQFEERTNPSTFDIGTTTGAFRFEVAGWQVHQHGALTFASTSSAFGFSEAAMVGPQAVDTLNGGTTMAALSDAFDGFFAFGLPNGAGGPTSNTYTDGDGIVDVTPTPTGPGRLTTTSGTILTGDFETGGNGGTFNGLELAQQNAVFSTASDTVPIIRSVFMVRNPTGSPITQTVGIFNNLGSDNNTALFATSSGDATFAPGTDRWAVSFQNFSGTTSSDPRILTVVQGPGTVAVQLDPTSNFVDADDNPRFNYNLTVQPGETQYILTFVGLYGSRAAAASDGAAVFDDLAALRSSGLLAGLSDDVLDGVVNWSELNTADPPPPPPPPAVVDPWFAVGSDVGALGHAQVFSPTGEQLLSIHPFPDYNGSVSVATGDVNNDGTADLIAATGQDRSHVKVFSGTDGSLLSSFFAFDAGFVGGVSVAAGDVNDDGFADIVVSANGGAHGHVKAFSGENASELYSFFAYDGYNGPLSVAVGDIDNDGHADIITGAAAGTTHVKAFSGADGSLLQSFFAFTDSTAGVNVGAGDLDNDGFAEIITGAATTTSHVKVFDGQTLSEEHSFFAFDGFAGGVRVGVNNGNLQVSAGPGAGPHVKLFGDDLSDPLLSLFAFEEQYAGGVFVG